MELSRTVSVLLVGAAIALTANPAHAQLPDDAVDCRTAIAKNTGKLLKTANKVIASCHKSRNAGNTPDTTDCNDMTQADSPKSKFAGSRTKVEASIEDKCAGQDGVLMSSGSPPYYSNCPVSCPGVPDPMTTIVQLADCLSCYVETLAEQAASTTLGMPVPAALTTDDAKCHGAIAKGYGKYQATAYKTETTCQKDEDEGGNHDPSSCVGYDPKSKVAGALLKADAGIESSCAAATVSSLDSCGADVTSLKSCSAAAFGDAEDEIFQATYEMQPCPATVHLTQLGGCSTIASPAGNCSNGGETASSFSEGWAAFSHDDDHVDYVTLGLDVTCPGSPGACGSCTVDGISTNNPYFDNFARCQQSPWIPCTNVGGADAACSGGTCSYFASPPVPTSDRSTPLCLVRSYDTDIGGTIDPDAGTVSLTTQLRSRIYLGISVNQPCPVCENDLTPQDGVTSGTCDGGARNGMPCDVHGFDLSFATTSPLDLANGVSLDCPPSAATNITGTGFSRSLTLTTGSVSLPAGDDCDAPLGALDCFCGVCSVDNAQTCNSDTECANLALGTCVRGSGPDRRPNSCTDNTCEATGGPGGLGACSGEERSYCSGFLRSDGKEVLECNTNTDCDGFVTGSGNPDDWFCPGDDCGDCTVERELSCFVNPISMTGTASPTVPVLVGATCLPAISNPAVNSAFGLPGPASTVMQTVLEVAP